MAIYYDDEKGVSVNIDSNSQKVSSTTFTATRKFTSIDLSQDNQPGEVKSNIDHLVDEAAGLKSLAITAEATAEQARLSLQSTREQLLNTESKLEVDDRQSLPSVQESDLAFSDNVKSETLAKRISDHSSAVDSGKMIDSIKNGLGDFVFSKKVDSLSHQGFNPFVPTLDCVSVGMEKNRGTVDCFFSSLKISLPTSQVNNGKLKALRIFRSQVPNPTFSRGVPPNISMRGLDLLATNKLKTRSKGLEQSVVVQKRYDELGLTNSISSLNKIDPQTNLRFSSNEDSLTKDVANESYNSSTNISAQNTQEDLNSFVDANKYSNLDKSVANDPTTLRNLRIQDPNYQNAEIEKVVEINVSKLNNRLFLSEQQRKLVGNGNSLVSDRNNSIMFKEIAFISLEKLKSRVVGQFTEFELIDETITFGSGYKYFVVSVDSNMMQSIRSKIVDIIVEGLRVPERPKRVFASNTQFGSIVRLNILVDDQLVEKFEVYRREFNASDSTNKKMMSTVVSDSKGYNFNVKLVEPAQNNFVKIGEGLNGGKQVGSTFNDNNTVPGKKYIYRIYSVDIFGNKSESPYETTIFVPDKKSKNNDLIKPDITSEIDSETGKIKLLFKCNDQRVRNLFIARRDLTIGQKSFTVPSQVNRIKFGLSNAAQGSKKFEDVVFRGDKKEVSWNGRFESDTSDITFVDTTTTLDHTYQYRIHGVDKFGNQTSYQFTKPLMVLNRPQVNPPVDIKAEAIQGLNFKLGGVVVSWKHGNNDKPAEDMMGSQGSLEDSAVRTLYQVERRRVGEEIWELFPLVSGTQLFDYFGRVTKFEPSTIRSNETYVYRVKSVQSGTFTSNYGQYTEVFAGMPVTAPINFKIKPSDANISPFYVVLNWDTQNDSGIVDSWTIERAATNNFSAASISMNNPFDFKKLVFSEYRKVFRESSRFSSAENDKKFIVDKTSNFIGTHNFQDTNVLFGNTYFYRIRSNGTDGRFSDWVYKGIKITSAATERVFNDLLTPERKKQIMETKEIISIKGLDRIAAFGKTNSFSLQPQFSSPTKTVSTVSARQSTDSLQTLDSTTTLKTK